MSKTARCLFKKRLSPRISPVTELKMSKEDDLDIENRK
jgi:hypothetical protein